MDKSHIIQVLRDMSLLLQIKGENPFKSRAYDLAADRIAGLTEEAFSQLTLEKLQELPGVGASLSERILELLQTGKMSAHEELKAEFPPKILELLEVEAIGPKKAARLFHELKIGDLESLETACREGRIRALSGFGAKTEEKILHALERRKTQKSSGRKPLAEVLVIAEQLLQRVRQAPGVVRAELGGSVRRFSETVGDVDLIASATNPDPVFDALVSHPQVADVLGRGETKCSVRLESGLQVDLRVLPDADFATALHHFTGSKAHHIRLRSRALERGLTLSEWGVFRGEEKLPVSEEAGIYALLDMQYVPPELREDRGEVEEAIAGTLASDWVTLESVKGMIHCHTTYSDGKSTLEAMALKAQALGFSYLTITEHSETAAYAQGLTLERLQRQWDEIDELNAKLKTLVLLKGIESDILEDGSLDYPDSVLEKLDVVIGSIHNRHGLNADDTTERLLNAFRNPYFHIWGHPTGRLIQERDPAAMHLDVLFKAAAAEGVVIEVNGCPERMDLSSEHIREALQRKVKLVVGSDAHHEDDLLRNLRVAVHTARKGGAQKHDVLNTQPVKAFLKALR